MVGNCLWNLSASILERRFAKAWLVALLALGATITVWKSYYKKSCDFSNTTTKSVKETSNLRIQLFISITEPNLASELFDLKTIVFDKPTFKI
jgi:hypothetical protein